MKLQARLHSAFVFVLLIACVIGCKSTSTSSTSTKTDSPKNTNSSTSSTTSNDSSPAKPPEIAGKYNVVGSNPDGGSYKGTLEVIPHGDVYQLRGNAGPQYDGAGLTTRNA